MVVFWGYNTQFVAGLIGMVPLELGLFKPQRGKESLRQSGIEFIA
jgi:hypothetical protein